MSDRNPRELMLRDDVDTEDILAHLRQEKEREGSFFGLVPNHLKKHVQTLAQANWEYYKRRFPDFDDFLERMAENWLAKSRAFPALAKASGLEDLGWTAAGRVKADSFMAVLTSSASYLLIGSGAFGENGGSVAYVRIPFRKGEDQRPQGFLKRLLGPNADEREEVSALEGVVIEDHPSVGSRWRIPGLGSTSPLLSIFGARDPSADHGQSTETLYGLHHTTSQAFRKIDDETLHG